jgi:DNA-binding MltR family transcriptional regulator
MTTTTQTEFDLGAFSKSLYAESDRACAVLGVALLDWRLEQLFRRRLTSFHRELLGSSQPIGTLSARIRLARALNWINDDARHDLDLVRSIRNDFAHSFDHTLTFSDSSVADRCMALKTALGFLEGFDIAAARPNNNLSPAGYKAMQSAFESPRARFQIAIDMLAQHMVDLKGGILDYDGADLLSEVRASSGALKIVISATATVGQSQASPAEAVGG